MVGLPDLPVAVVAVEPGRLRGGWAAVEPRWDPDAPGPPEPRGGFDRSWSRRVAPGGLGALGVLENALFNSFFLSQAIGGRGGRLGKRWQESF